MNRPYVECHENKTGFRNTGAKKQCVLGKTVKFAFGVPGFKFASIEDAKDETKWNEAIAQKKLFPLFDAEEYAVADTEPTYWEGENTRIETSKGKKIRTFRSILGLCSYFALKSFDGQEGQIFEFTNDPGVKAILGDNGIVKGQTATLNVGRLQDSTGDMPQNAVVTVNYKDFNERENSGADLKTDWSHLELFGIFDAHLELVSASATQIKVKVRTGCGAGDELITSLQNGELEVRNAAGALVTTTFVEADSEGIYTLTGTAFATNHTVSLVGVVSIDNQHYESAEPLKVTIS